MNVFYANQPDDMKQFAFRSWLQQLQAIDREAPGKQELTQIYATCVIAYRAANKRGDAVAMVPMVIEDQSGEPLSETNPIVRAIRRNYQDNLRRSEITLCYQGKNLLAKRRAYSDIPYALRWLNPNLWNTEVRWGNLYRFNVRRNGRNASIDDRYLYPKDVVFMHGFDFADDYDGVAPAEAAFLHEQLSVEMVTTQLSFMQNRAVPTTVIQPVQGTTGPSDDKERDRLEGLLQRLYKGARNAGRTMLQRFRWEVLQLQANFDDVKFDTHYEQAYESVAIAFDIPIALIRESASNYAQAEVARRDWGQSWLVPRMGWYAEQFTEQLCNEPVIVKRFGKLTVKPDTTNVAMLKEDQTALVNRTNSQVDGGYRDLYSAAIETGVKNPPEVLKGKYMWGGVPTPIEVIDQLWQSRLPAPPISMDTASPEGGVLPAQPAEAGKDGNLPALPPPAPPISGREACVMIGVQNQGDLVALQRRIATQYPDKQIKWNNADSFHVTLAYIPVATDMQIAALKSALEQIELPDLSLKLGRLACFDNVGEHALHFRVSKTAPLTEFHAEVHDLCQACGMVVSQHHEPAAYTPHITMGYSTEPLPTIMYHGGVKAKPVDLQLSVDHTIVYRRTWGEDIPEPPVQRRFIPDDQFKELRDWQALLKRKGLDYAFTAKALPAHAVRWVETALDVGYEPTLIFDTLRMGLLSGPDYAFEPDETPCIIEAWKAAEQLVGVKSYMDTRSAFIDELISIIGDGQTNAVTRRTFASRMRTSLRQFGLLALRDGMEEVGYNPESLSPEIVKAFNDWLKKQSAYVSNFGAEVFKEGISEIEVRQRATMWADVSLDEARIIGVIAAGDPMLKRILGQVSTEHCSECKILADQVHPASEWKKRDLLIGTHLTSCKQGCACSFVVTDEQERGNWLEGAAPAKSDNHNHESIAVA